MAETVAFSALDKATQERILNQKNVNFQGNLTSLRELLAPLEKVDLDDIMDPDMLSKLTKNETVKVGREIESVDESVECCYIPRTIKECSRNGDNYPEEAIFKRLLRRVCTNEIQIIGAAGTGKSTVLKNIARIIKRERPHLWVLQIDLNDYSTFLKEWQSIPTVLDLINSKPESKLNDFETKIFSLPRKVVVMLDGVEEVCPDKKEMVRERIWKCISELNKDVYNCIFMTESNDPHYTIFSPDTLIPFSESDQVGFLRKYWESMFRPTRNKEKCEVYAEAVIKDKWFDGKDDLVGIALQLRMVAEVLGKSDNFDDGSEWDGCYDFINSNNTKPVLPKKITLIQLYQLYIHKRCSGELKTSLTSVRSDITKINVGSNGYLNILALKSVLKEENWDCFSCYKNRAKEIPEVTFGIVKKLGFTHRTFADYFVAECVANQLAYYNEQFLTFLVNEILIEARFKIIRMFLNKFIQEDIGSYPDGLFKTMGHLLKHTNNSAMYVSAKEGNLEIIKLIFRCFNVPVNVDDVRVRFETPLHVAVKGSHDKVVEFLVEKYASIEARDYEDRTPLHLAAKTGSLGMVKYLIDRGAGVKSKDSKGNSVLGIAAARGYLEMAKYLLTQGVDVNTRNRYGYIPLHKAAESGDLDMVKVLVQNGADVNANSRLGSYRVLRQAIRSDNLEVVKYLVEKGAEFTFRSESGGTVLHIPHKNLDVTKFFIEKGVDINDVNERGETVLVTAIKWDCTVGFIKCLVDNGADINLKSDAMVISAAMGRGRLDIVRYLVEKGARLDDCPDLNKSIFNVIKEKNLDLLKYLAEIGTEFNGETINVAIKSGNLNVVKILIQNGALIGVLINGAESSGDLDVIKFLIENGCTFDNVKDVGDNVELLQYLQDINVKVDEASIFHKAAGSGNLSIIKLLTVRGINVNCRDESGRTPLHEAAKCNNVYIVNYLLEHGAKASVKDKRGYTPLCEAIDNDHVKSVKLLVNKADINALDGRGVTPLHFACQRGNSEIVKFLVERGAQVNVYNEDIGTPLCHYCKYFSNLEVINFLSEKDPDFSCKFEELVPRLLKNCNEPKNRKLLNALFSQLPIVKYLIEKGVELSAEEINSRQLLLVAVRGDDLDLVTFLVEKGADVNYKLVRHYSPGETVLFNALQTMEARKNLNIIKLLVEYGADVNAKDDNGCSIPLTAFIYNNLTVCKYLVENGADINAADKSGQTVLHRAVQSSFTQTKYLFDMDVKVNVTTNGRSVLHEAIATEYSDLDTVRYLINNGLDINCADNEGRTPLLEAVARKDLDAVKLLAEKGAKLNGDGLNLLLEALGQNDENIVKYLVGIGANINAKTETCSTLLHQATLKDNLRLVRFLIGVGADVNAMDQDGCTPLHDAAQVIDITDYSLEIMKFLLEKGAKVDIRKLNGRTALHEAASTRNLSKVKLLVEHGADVNAKDESGRNTLFEPLTSNVNSCRGSAVEVIEFLIKSGADFSCRANNGRTLLHEAAAVGNLDVVKLLLELDVDVNAKTKAGRTALHEAAKNGWLEVVEVLVEAGVDVEAKTSKGRTALFKAIIEKHDEVVQFLRKLKRVRCESGGDDK